MNSLQRGSPESVGLSSQNIHQCIAELEKSGTRMHSFMVWRRGKVVSEAWWTPYSPDIPHSCHSLGKSYTAAAAGIAVREGLLDIDELVMDIFADEIAAMNVTVDEKFKRLKVRHVMSMSNGMAFMADFDENWMRNYFSCPITYEPGTRFLYNTLGACMLGAIVEKKTGMGLKDYMKLRMFDKIGIDSERFIWLKFFNSGITAEPGVCATTEDNLRLAILYLNLGSWNGEQIMDADWTREAMTKQVETDTDPGSLDARSGYGFQLWIGRIPGIVRFDGGQGQFCLIDQRTGTIVAIHEGGTNPCGVDIVRELVYKYILNSETLPDSLPEDYDALRALRFCEASREVRRSVIAPLSRRKNDFAGHYRVTAGDPQPWIEVSPGGYNFYHLFYDPGAVTELSTVDIEMNDNSCDLVFNGTARFHALFDGSFEVRETENVFALKKTCCNAYFEGPDTLHVDIRWLNGWFDMRVTIQLQEDGRTAGIAVRKDTLDENRPYILRTGLIEKI